jgi:hypothetical protein
MLHDSLGNQIKALAAKQDASAAKHDKDNKALKKMLDTVTKTQKAMVRTCACACLYDTVGGAAARARQQALEDRLRAAEPHRNRQRRLA